MKPLTGTLDLPPTLNHLYRRTGQGVYLAPEAKRWQRDAGLMLPAGKAPSCPLLLEVVFYFDRERDIDNGLKLLIDTLAAKWGFDDKWIHRLTVKKLCDKQNPRALVRLSTLEVT